MCGWIDFTSNAGVGPSVRRVKMWPLPSSVLQMSMGGSWHVSGQQEAKLQTMLVSAWFPFLICGGTCRHSGRAPWFLPGQMGISMTLMISTSTNQMGSAMITLLTIHLSDSTGRCYLEGITSLQVLYGHSNSQLQIHPCIAKINPTS